MKSLSLDDLEHKLGTVFNDKQLLKEALTHRSYLNENPEWKTGHNERLEFLGDAVLELVVTEQLYTQFPQANEGELTAVRAALVNYQSMARLAQTLGVGDYIKMSKGEARDKGRAREVILANAMEAVLGAMYLDSGIEPLSRLVAAHLISEAETVLHTKSYKDPKSHLQELVQEKDRVTPTYKVLEEEGPAHQRTFKIGVFVGDKLAGEGTGPSKQEAEALAAKQALGRYQ